MCHTFLDIATPVFAFPAGPQDCVVDRVPFKRDAGGWDGRSLDNLTFWANRQETWVRIETSGPVGAQELSNLMRKLSLDCEIFPSSEPCLEPEAKPTGVVSRE